MQEETSTSTTDESPQRDFADYFFLFLERSWIILICLIGAGVYAQYKLSKTPETFRATATVEVVRNLEAAGDISSSAMQWRAYTDMAATVSQKLNLDSLFYAITEQPVFADRLPAKDTVSEGEYEEAKRRLASLMNGITDVTFRPRSPLLDIEIIYTDPVFAKNVIAGMLEEYEKLGSSKRAGESTANLEFLTKEIGRIRSNLSAAEQSLVIYKGAFEIREDIRESEAEIREMEKVFLDKWPALVQEKANLVSLQKSYADELARITDSSDTEYEFWESHAGKMAELSGNDLTSYQIRTAEARNNMLTRDFQTDTKLYDSLLEQMKRGDVESEFKQSEIAIVQSPYASDRPIGPIPMKFYIRYGILGLGGGFLIAFFLGIMDSTIRRVEDLEKVSGLPAFSAIPKSAKLKGETDLDPKNASTEAFRTLHTNVILKAPKARTILITSSIPGEGKSTVSCNLAATASSWGWGEKVLLIDLDLRRPQVGNYLGLTEKKEGINDCLQGACTIEEAIQTHPDFPELDVMTAGTLRFQNGLPDNKIFGELLERLKSKYDRIIIDTAPVLAVNDTMVIARHVDAVCLVFRMWKTPRKAVVRALNQLSGNETPPVGMIANFMPLRKGLGQYGYYFSYSGGNYQSNA